MTELFGFTGNSNSVTGSSDQDRYAQGGHSSVVKRRHCCTMSISDRVCKFVRHDKQHQHPSPTSLYINTHVDHYL